jgi:hypothetical protein
MSNSSYTYLSLQWGVVLLHKRGASVLSLSHLHTHTFIFFFFFFQLLGQFPYHRRRHFSLLFIFLYLMTITCVFFSSPLSLYLPPHLIFFLFVVVMCAHTKGRKKERKKEKYISIANDNFRVIGRRPYWTHPAEAKSHPASVKFGCYRILYRHSCNSSDYSGGVNLVAIFTIIIFFFLSDCRKEQPSSRSRESSIINTPVTHTHTHTHTQSSNHNVALLTAWSKSKYDLFP